MFPIREPAGLGLGAGVRRIRGILAILGDSSVIMLEGLKDYSNNRYSEKSGGCFNAGCR